MMFALVATFDDNPDLQTICTLASMLTSVPAPGYNDPIVREAERRKGRILVPEDDFPSP